MLFRNCVLFITINHDFLGQSLKPQLSWALKYLTDKQTWDFATGQYNWCETIHKQAIEPAQCHVVAKQQWIFWVRKLIRCGDWLALAFRGHPASSQKSIWRSRTHEFLLGKVERGWIPFFADCFSAIDGLSLRICILNYAHFLEPIITYNYWQRRS